MKLKDIPLKELVGARVRKMVLDVTSVKFGLLVFVAYGVWVGKIDQFYGLSYLAVGVGIKELVDFKEKHIETKKLNGG